jgi:hypothetical protein
MAKNNEENVATAEAAAPEAEATATATETAAQATPHTIILTSPTQDGLFHAFLDLKKEHKDDTVTCGAAARNQETGEFSLRVDII